MSNYTLDQAQRDIAQLRFLLTSLSNAGKLGNPIITGSITLPDNSVWNSTGLAPPLPLASGGTGVSAASDAALLAAIGAAPTASPTFTGTVTGPDGSTWTSTGINKEAWSNLSISLFTVTTARYKKISLSNFIALQLELTAFTGSDGNTIATLPSGYRPATTCDFPGESNSNTYGGTQTPHINISTAGVISMWGVGGTHSFAGAWLVPLD